MNRFLFPRWINKFLAIVPLLLLGGGAFGGALFMGATDPVTLNPGYMPDQPVPFSHQIHAGELKMDCRYCHTSVQKAAHASIPPTATCINCHSPVENGVSTSLAAVHPTSKKLRAVHESWESDKSIPWQRIHRLPDYVYFNHSAHVNRGVSCVSCHGRIDTMAKVYQAKELSMAWCLECHNNPAPHIRPTEYITKLDWQPEGETEEEREANRIKIGEQLIEEKGINPQTNCAVCHR